MAQKPEISFNETTYDFGTIAEEDGNVTHVYEFTNTGSSDLLLSQVQASCGCTTPQWIREPIAPKEKGTITVTYRTAGRPGPFTKSITVTSNAGKQILFIKGVVIPKGQNIETAYPILKGDVRIISESINFGDITHGENKTARFSLANNAKSDVFVNFINLPVYITAESKKIKVDEKSNITLSFDTKKAEKWGRINEDIVFVTGDVKNKKTIKHKVTVLANIIEQFTQEQISNAPTIQIAGEIVAGEVQKGKKKTVVATFKNTGKSPLYIRNLSSDDSCILIHDISKPIKPGDEGKLKITIDATDLATQDYRKAVNIMSNDPKNVNKSFMLTFKVK